MSNKLFLIDETGEFVRDKWGDSCIFGVYFEDCLIEELNKDIQQLKENNDCAYDLHHTKIKLDEQLIRQFIALFNNNERTPQIIRTSGPPMMAYDDDHNHMIATEALLRKFIVENVEIGDDVKIYIANSII